jgi:hypothetical protein
MDEYTLDFDGSIFNLKRKLCGSSIADDGQVMVHVNCKLEHYEAVLYKLMEADDELALGLFSHPIHLEQPMRVPRSLVPEILSADGPTPSAGDLEIFSKMLVEQESQPAQQDPKPPRKITAPAVRQDEPASEEGGSDAMGELMLLLKTSVEQLGHTLSGEYTFSEGKFHYKVKLNGQDCATGSDAVLTEAQGKASFVALYNVNSEAALAWDAKYKGSK